MGQPHHHDLDGSVSDKLIALIEDVRKAPRCDHQKWALDRLMEIEHEAVDTDEPLGVRLLIQATRETLGWREAFLRTSERIPVVGEKSADRLHAPRRQR
ncbi:hypothetical protein MMMDOFMJ_2512 [Methylobacterium gnaphalii]|uniref:Uncharacterized protein n=1 Tax=Methylobacterium gnaphalii TaxID=1010610 RepID=A0A512JNV5_9HYPH|nr:hypothetical protein MGN01_34670 [Methylobacterium gnaphalii]GJD69575.1 hypothetical protein MMMDOFMJ_2512 [Methylobacterium gnaphalii]GLS49115.1 hypothetical protein GCM10007885_19630 [Methylobacterium gnaphalii]